MGKIKIKHRAPKRTEFTPNDIVIDVKNGRLFYKSNFDTFKVVGVNTTNFTTSSITAAIDEETVNQINTAIEVGDNVLAAEIESNAIAIANLETSAGGILDNAANNEVLFNNGGTVDGNSNFTFLPSSGILELPITNANNALTTLGTLTVKSETPTTPADGGGVNISYNNNSNQGQLRINTEHGFLRIAPGNGSLCHFDTDVGAFYMNKRLVVNGGDVRSYDEDMVISAVNKSKITLKNDSTDPLVEIGGDLIAKAQNDSLGKLSAENDIIAFASDKRLKENIVEISNPLDKIKQLRGVYYDWKKDVKEKGFHPGRKINEIGMVAQEVEKVIPQAIEPAPFNNDYKTIKYNRIIPLLVECIKDQQKQIDELKNKLDGYL